MPTQANKDILTWITGAQSEADVKFVSSSSRGGGNLFAVGSNMNKLTSRSDVVWGTGALGVKGACSAPAAPLPRSPASDHGIVFCSQHIVRLTEWLFVHVSRLPERENPFKGGGGAGSAHRLRNAPGVAGELCIGARTG